RASVASWQDALYLCAAHFFTAVPELCCAGSSRHCTAAPFQPFLPDTGLLFASQAEQRQASPCSCRHPNATARAALGGAFLSTQMSVFPALQNPSTREHPTPSLGRSGVFTLWWGHGSVQAPLLTLGLLRSHWIRSPSPPCPHGPRHCSDQGSLAWAQMKAPPARVLERNAFRSLGKDRTGPARGPFPQGLHRTGPNWLCL
uniref:Uncharacterized protein n=1 Tax=Apteryx owenii TaxID=8824 RepID=A0A8B9PC89_APTOW